MSYFYIKPIFGGGRLTDARDALSFVEGRSQTDRAADRAIDAALRSVPLPEGLMSRLGMMVYAMSDDATDQIDYLGC